MLHRYNNSKEWIDVCVCVKYYERNAHTLKLQYELSSWIPSHKYSLFYWELLKHITFACNGILTSQPNLFQILKPAFNILIQSDIKCSTIQYYIRWNIGHNCYLQIRRSLFNILSQSSFIVIEILIILAKWKFQYKWYLNKWTCTKKEQNLLTSLSMPAGIILGLEDMMILLKQFYILTLKMAKYSNIIP